MKPQLPVFRSLILLPLFLSLLSAGDLTSFRATDDRIYLTWQRDPLTTMTIMNLKQIPTLPPVVKPKAPETAVALPRVGDVELDGTASDWWEDGLALQFLPNLEGRLPDASDLHAEFRMGWNDQGLIIAAKIKDDQASEADLTAKLWQGDSIEVFIAEKVGSSRRYQALVAGLLQNLWYRHCVPGDDRMSDFFSHTGAAKFSLRLRRNSLQMTAETQGVKI